MPGGIEQPQFLGPGAEGRGGWDAIEPNQIPASAPFSNVQSRCDKACVYREGQDARDRRNLPLFSNAATGGARLAFFGPAYREPSGRAIPNDGDLSVCRDLRKWLELVARPD